MLTLSGGANSFLFMEINFVIGVSVASFSVSMQINFAISASVAFGVSCRGANSVSGC